LPPNLLKDYTARQDFLRDRGETLRATRTNRALVDLLVEQIEFADVIVLNKVSDTSARRIWIWRAEKSSTRSIPTQS
jgi:G3E family GTPase